SAGQFVFGTRLFYKPGGSGTFRVTAATSDPETGVTGVSFPAIANVTGGRSVASAPYRVDYTWGASARDSGSHDGHATNGAAASRRCDERRRGEVERTGQADAGLLCADGSDDHAHRRERSVLRRRGHLLARRRERRRRLRRRHVVSDGHARERDTQRRHVRHV